MTTVLAEEKPCMVTSHSRPGVLVPVAGKCGWSSKTEELSPAEELPVEELPSAEELSPTQETKCEPVVSTSIFHARDFVASTHLRIGSLTKGVYDIVDVSNFFRPGKKAIVQLSGGGILPPFAVATSQFGDNIVLNLDDESEYLAFFKLQEDILAVALERRNDWFSTTLSDLQIRENMSLVVRPGKVNVDGTCYAPTVKFAYDKKDLQPRMNEKTGIVSKRTLLKIVDEDNNPVNIETLPGRRWKTAIFTIFCIYLQKTGKFGLTRRLNYLEVTEPVEFGGAGSVREITNYNLRTDGQIGPNLIKKDKFGIVNLANQDDGRKICLRFSGGGNLPMFACDTNQFGTHVLNFQIGESEEKALADFELVVREAVVANRSCWAPQSKATDEYLRDESMNRLVTEGKPKKEGGGMWPAITKTNYDPKEVNLEDKKVVIEDVNGDPVELCDLPGRDWITVDVVYSCVYIQGGSKGSYGISRSLVKLVVDHMQSNMDIEPLPVPDRPVKRSKINFN
jgi:hypothetical protein